MPASAPLDASVHLIQVALTPVFLLSGIAALLGVFANRQGQLASRIDELSRELRAAGDGERPRTAGEMTSVRRRTHMLDAAAALAATGATSVALSILVLFLSALRASVAADLLVYLFGFAVICTIGAVVLFGVEMVLGGNLIRARVHLHLPGFGRHGRGKS